MTNKTVFIVDDDHAMAESLRWLVESDGLHTQIFHTGKALMEALPKTPCGCILLDIRMPGISGLELQNELNKKEPCIPVIFVTGHGDVPMAVRAMKAGAFDFLIKPFQDPVLLDTIHRALRKEEKTRHHEQRLAQISARLHTLTPREFEVMTHVVRGRLNKAIAIDLGIGTKTVEIHRARIMRKFEVRSLAELVKDVLLHDLHHHTPRIFVEQPE